MIADMVLILICEYHDSCLREHLCPSNFGGFLCCCFIWGWFAHLYSFLSYGVRVFVLFVFVLCFVCQCLSSFLIAPNVYRNLRFFNCLEDIWAFPIYLVSFGTWRNISSCCNLVYIWLFMRFFVVHEIVLFCYLWYCVSLILRLIIFYSWSNLVFGYLKKQSSR